MTNISDLVPGSAPIALAEGGGLSETTVSRLAQRIRSDILSGRLPFGARLKLRELAEQYRVSQMPVRDALVRLAAEGLIDLQPNRGASVRSVDRQFLENMFDIRMVLEELLVRRAIERSTDAQLATLVPLAEAHAAAAGRGVMSEVLSTNSRFHERITALAQNADAARILDQGWELIHALRGQVGYATGRLAQIAAEHAAIVAAMVARDVDTAGQLARQHVERSRDDVSARFPLSPTGRPDGHPPQP